MNRLADKTALITGASSGIGLATAKRFHAEGARVFLTGRRTAELERAARELGVGATAITADMSVLGDIERACQLVKEQAGQLDVLFANAGVASFAPLGEITEREYDRIFDINVKGMVFTVQKALPLMRDGGAIILTGSTTSIMGTPAFSVYSATKAAIRNFARTWILDLKTRGIRVNVLSPGPTQTPGLLELVPAEQRKAFLNTLAQQVPLGRVADPDEIAKVAVFLASDASSFVNGVELFADGGAAQV